MVPSYEQWLDWVFDHPVTGRQWQCCEELEGWDEEQDPRQAVAYLTQLFENSASLATRFSDAQLNQGLYFLISPGSSSHCHALLNAEVPWTERERGIPSIVALYRDLFVSRCSAHLGHLQPAIDWGTALSDFLKRWRPHDKVATVAEPNPLNAVCYMWWDVCPLLANPRYPDQTQTDGVVLELLAAILRLPTPACQESALHGLGHLDYSYPKAVAEIIDGYLQREPGISKPLREYAKRARSGSVL